MKKIIVSLLRFAGCALLAGVFTFLLVIAVRFIAWCWHAGWSLFLCAILCVLCTSALNAPAQGFAPVTFSEQQLTGQTSNRRIVVTADEYPNPLFTLGQNLAAGTQYILQPVGGSVTTNLYEPWGYTVLVDGWPRSAHIMLTSTNPVYAGSIISTNMFSPLIINIFDDTNVNLDTTTFDQPSFIVGPGNTYAGNSTVFGIDNNVQAYSTVFGIDNTVGTGANTVAGEDSQVFNDSSSFGNGNYVYQDSTGFGYGLTSTNYSVAGGNFSFAENGAVALGYSSFADGSGDGALGTSLNVQQTFGIPAAVAAGLTNTWEIGPGSATNNGWLHYMGVKVVDQFGNHAGNSITITGGCITNNGFVWYTLATNGIPAIAAPGGSLCTTTNGQLWVRSNNAAGGVWLLK